MSKKVLGRGLSALIPEMEPSQEVGQGNEDKIWHLAVEDIKPREDQPRRFFSEEKLEELAASIREHGLLQPIIVSKWGKGYEIIAGERRWRACRKLGLESIPAIVKELEQVEINELALIENLQREDLNAIEEALALHKLLNGFSLTQEAIAQKLGKSRPYIANSLRLLNLPPEVQQLVASGQLSAGHVRPLIGIKDKLVQAELVKVILKKGLSVRQTEQLVKDVESRPTTKPAEKKTVKKDSVLHQVEDRLRSRFGTGVRIKRQGAKGKIEIEYYSDDDLNRILDLVLGEIDF
ncbi:MAG TPA: ParB/RepB/Spo0J family partition protein [Bacillota bacterium]|nr:ParB/RepB/Spo0J family partition protein [Bacillota bacterium]